MKASEVVEKAKAQGLAVSTNLVYVARHSANKKKRGSHPAANHTASAPKKAVHVPSANALGPASLSEQERELARLVVMMGLDRVEAVVARVRKAFS
jgi:hypothetical protein